MKTTIHQRAAQHSLTQQLGRAAAYAAIGLAGIVAPVAHGQTNTNGCTAAPAGLVGWWRAEGDAADYTGAHSGSFPFGSAFTSGVVGQAFDFDGSSRRVSIPDSPAFQLTNALTLEAWVYPRAYGGFITFRGDNRGGLDNWTLDTYDSGFVKFTLIDPANNVATVRTALALNQWQHVAATWSRASGDLKIYINGTLGAQTNSPLVPIGVLDPTSEPAIGIGNHGGTFHQFPFNGLIDELGIYNRALNSNEVALVYQSGSAGKCTTTNLPGGAGVPVITSFTPATAIPGGQVVLAGQNFSPVAASNIVYFGATKATVLTASSNQLVVSVPSGATFAPPTVTVNGLTAAAQAAFTPTFAGTGLIASTNFAPRFSLGTGTGPTQTAIADFDGDGKPDLAATDDYADSISVYRNISPGGALTGNHFEPRIALPASTANYSPYMLIAGDVDGDGRLDLVASDVDGNTVSVFRNQGNPGSLSSNSFAPFVTFAVGASPRAVALTDLDGDGRPEIITANYHSSTVSILRNGSSPGTITTTSFPSRVDFAVGAGPQGLTVTDLDGDGRSDIATGNSIGNSLSLLRNVGTGPLTSNSFAAAVTFSGPNYGHFLKAVELDGDGRPELLVSSYLGQSVSLYRNQSAPGGFTATSFALVTAPALSGRGHTLACGDLNGDGKPDIAIDTELADSVTLFQNTHTSGDVTAASLGARVDLPAGWNAWGTSIGDLDGDNRPDLVVANTYDNTISIYQNLTAMNTNPPSPAGWLLSVDFGSDLNGKTGFAALGQTTNDFWNFYSRDDGAGGWRTFGVLSNLKTVAGTVTPVGLTVANAPGAWGNGSPDAMYDDYIYPFNGGNVTVTVTNLPVGQYDLLAYAYDGNFELTSGGVSHGIQTTRDNIRTNPPGWTAGIQYARFTNVSVALGQPLVLTVRPGLDGYAVISGLQLSASLATNTVPGTNPPAGNCVAVPTGAISWWRGEGSALDDIRSNNGSVVGGVTTVPGKVGNGFGFDGTGYIVVPHDPSLNNSNAFTIELWYKSTQNPNLDYGLIDKRVGFTGANFGINAVAAAGLGVYYDDLGAQDGDDTGSSFESSRYTPIPAPGVFHHLAATYWQISNNVVRLEMYLNGQNVRTRYIAGNLANTINTTPVTIGATAQGAGEFFKGVIDEVTLYNRVLSPAEILSIYGADANGKCAPPNQSPVITQHPQDTVVIAGGTAQFAVVATGVPSPGYQWYFNDFQLNGQTNSTLILSNVLPGQDGNYTVRVFNPSGSLLSSNATLTVVTTQAVVLADGATSGFYNEALGTILDGTAPQFPLPFGQGDDPTLFPADEPNLAAATNILGDWLAMPPALNSNWQAVAVIPHTWALNTETAIIYPVDAGSYGIADLRGNFDADNGIYIWVNGQFKFGARAPGLPSPAGLFEYTNVFLGNLPPGSNYIQILREDSGITTGSQIRITGTALSTNRQPPVIAQSPTNQTVAAGSYASFIVVADGTPELSYQWRYEGADLSGQTGNSLALLNVQPTNAGNYSVLVSNAYGSVTSSIATLTVLTYPPTITSQPQDRSIYVGQAATFAVTATGTAPLRYYWSQNGSNLPNAISATLNLANVQTNAAGLYQVIVSNAFGVATSRLAQLTVLLPPPCTPAPEGVIAWWPGQSNLWDIVGGFDATPAQSLPYSLYTTGKVGVALNLGDNQNYAIVRTGGGLNVNAGPGLTIEGWIRPSSLSGFGPVAEWSDGRSAVGAGLLINSGGPGAIEATLTDTNLPRTTVTLRSAAYAVTNGLWQHVALTFDKSNGLAAIYVNGNLVAQTNTGSLTPTTTGDVYLGYRPVGLHASSRFNGALDEITLYNRALLQEELQAIVASDLTGKCPPLPPACVTPPAGIAAWWRGESNTVDMVAGNDAVRIPTNYPVTLAYQAGQLGAAFRFYAQNYLSVPRSEGLDIGTGSGLTVEGWIYPATLTSMPIVEWTDTNSYGANLWLSYSRGPTVLEANLIDTAGGYHLIRSPINTIRGYSWQHVAVTYDKTTGLAALYSDGNLVISTNLGLFTPRTDKNLLIGYHPRNTVSGPDGTPPTVDRWFNGAIDELALYRRALTAAEIRNVARTRPGKCLELPPTISRHPQPQVALEGGIARFDVGVGGTAPFQYQWLLAGQPLPGATNAALSLAGVDLADAGLYSVLVSNLLGSTTSRTAALTVLPANQCLPPAYGFVAFWRGESNVVDELGRHPAAWGTNTIPAYTTARDGGKVATAFRFSGANHLQIPSDADLNVGAGGGFTIEGWIKPDSNSGSQPIWDWSDSKGNIGVGLMLGRTGPGALEVTLTDTNALSTIERIITLTTPNYTLGSPTNALPRWFHIGLTFDKAARNVALYVDGRLVAERSVPLINTLQYNYGPSLFSPATTGNLYFGWRPYGSGQGARFRGAMDEMSVYYRALTPLELQAIYVVGSNGKCTPAPTCQSLAIGAVSWWRGESNVLDSVAGNHGIPNPSPGGPGISYTNGIVGIGFKTDSSRYVQIPASPSLNVGTGSGLTFETWFKPDRANSTFALASWNLGSTQGVSIGTSPTRGAGYLEANLVDTAGIARTISFFIHASVVSGIQPWQHLAVTYDKPSGQAILYLNGSPVVVTNLGSFTPRTTGVLNLGFRPQTSVGGASLTGTLDETALYNRALTSGEITANYRNAANRCMEPPVIVSHTGNLRVNAGSNAVFTVEAIGSPLLRYQWGLDPLVAPNAALPGQTNASLILTNVQAKNAGHYWVRVTNAFGLAAVSNLVLTVNSAPRANNQTVTTPEDAARNLTLSAFDLDHDPLLYTVLTQPTNGTLSGTNANLIYTPKPNFFGADSFTFRANDGLLNSATATVAIVVTPVNDPPSASSQIVTTDEDTPLPIILSAYDADGDVLTFTLAPPAHGTLSGTAPNLVYTPQANYFGADLFTYTVTDSSNAVSQLAAVSITVRPVNDAPEARIEIAPLDELPGVTNTIVIAPVCCTATVRLDASQSRDVENDALTYAWLVGTNVLSTEVIVTNRFQPGTHEITLIVSDGTEAVSKTLTVEIITSSEAVDYLKLLVEAGVTEPRTRMPLLNWLRQAGDFFDRCHVEPGVHFLELFKDRVAERLGTSDPELAKSLIDTAEAIIEAAPDCDPCQRLGRKDRQHDRDRDRKDRDGRNDQDDRNRPGDRNSADRERERNDRDSQSAREASPAQSSQVEVRPLPIETGTEHSQPKSRQ